MNKYEQLIEFIINDESEQARKLFHDIVVEKSRDIYEGLMDEEVGGNEVEDLVDEIECDEEGISEEEDGIELVGDADSEEGNDFDVDAGEFGDDEGAEEGGLEDRVLDLESALDELKAEFDELMAGEAGEEEHADMFGGDDEGAEEFGSDEDLEGDEGAEQFGGEEDEIVREYVEKVADQGQKSEGGEVGTGKRASINTKTPLAGKNDMGGTAKNIAQGKAGTSQDGRSPTKASNEYTKGQGNIKSGNINVPGGKAGNAYKTKEGAKSGEGQTTDGKVSVSTKSPLAK